MLCKPGKQIPEGCRGGVKAEKPDIILVAINPRNTKRDFMIIDTPMIDTLRLHKDIFGECDTPKYIPSFENAIATLTFRQAELLRYRYSNKTYVEIAKAENMHPSSVRSSDIISLRKIRRYYIKALNKPIEWWDRPKKLLLFDPRERHYKFCKQSIYNPNEIVIDYENYS